MPRYIVCVNVRRRGGTKNSDRRREIERKRECGKNVPQTWRLDGLMQWQIINHLNELLIT